MNKIQLTINNVSKTYKTREEAISFWSTNDSNKKITSFKFEEEYSFQSVDEMLAKAGF